MRGIGGVGVARLRSGGVAKRVSKVDDFMIVVTARKECLKA